MFQINEDFREIITAAAGNAPLSIKIIPTGWTNIVIEAELPGGEYFFRFPRDAFWSEMIVKDCAFCDYIHGKTSFETPAAKLARDAQGRPFSMHKKIAGHSLTEKYPAMTPEQIKRVAKDIVRFISEISSLPVDKAPLECRMPASEFLARLGDTHFGGCAPEHYKRLLDAENRHSVMAHADLNPGNILVNDDGAAIAVIDFCFAGVGGEFIDLSRIIGRLPPPFGVEIAKAAGANMKQVEPFAETWRYIEREYIKYMKANCPEIKLPDGA